jgi:hypothetical protein
MSELDVDGGGLKHARFNVLSKAVAGAAANALRVGFATP